MKTTDFLQLAAYAGALLALAAFGIYATHDVVIKVLGADYSSFQIMFFAGLLGLPIVTVMLLSDRTDGNLIARHPWWSLLRALTTVTTGAESGLQTPPALL